jgi:hypothetical protein
MTEKTGSHSTAAARTFNPAHQQIYRDASHAHPPAERSGPAASLAGVRRTGA